MASLVGQTTLKQHKEAASRSNLFDAPVARKPLYLLGRQWPMYPQNAIGIVLLPLVQPIDGSVESIEAFPRFRFSAVRLHGLHIVCGHRDRPPSVGNHHHQPKHTQTPLTIKRVLRLSPAVRSSAWVNPAVHKGDRWLAQAPGACHEQLPVEAMPQGCKQGSPQGRR
jgi:hypothetical protein